MKLTQSKRQWIDQRVRHYCGLLKVEVPELFLRASDYNEWKRIKRGQLAGLRIGRTASRYLGVCHRTERLVYLNVKRAGNLRELDHTIAHELIHLAKPGYSHGHAFDVAIYRLRKGRVTEKGELY